jgi:hypothetical protein
LAKTSLDSDEADEIDEIDEIDQPIDIGDRNGVRFADEDNPNDADDHGHSVVAPSATLASPVVEDTIGIDVETYSEPLPSVSYSDAVQCFLEWLLAREGRNIKAPESFNGVCELCVADPTVDDIAKEKIWGKYSTLLKHQNGNVHSGLLQWRRTMFAKFPQGGFICSYPGCSKGQRIWKTILDLQRHIQEAAHSDQDDMHAEAIRAHGWHEESFCGDKHSAAVKAQRRKENLAAKVKKFNRQPWRRRYLTRVKTWSKSLLNTQVMTVARPGKNCHGSSMVFVGPVPLPKTLPTLPQPAIPETLPRDKGFQGWVATARTILYITWGSDQEATKVFLEGLEKD